jgi:hypothetical protein
MQVSAILKSAARKIGVVASGESLTSDEQSDALTALQSMLRSWAAEKINVFSSVRENVTLVASTSLYTWGTGGTISTARPNQVLSAYIVDSSGTSHPVDIISEGRYNQISLKTLVRRPHSLYPQYTFPRVNVYLYPVPDAAETLTITSLKPFTETSSFSSTSSTLSMPAQYEEPIIYNLAVRLAPEFGKTVSRELALTAMNSYNRLTTLNSANYVEPVKIVLPVSASGGYSINSDSYR